MAEAGGMVSKIPSKLPQRQGMGAIPRPKPQAGPVSMMMSRRVTRRSMSCSDLRDAGAAPVPIRRNAPVRPAAASTQRTVQLPRKRPAATNITTGPTAKKPLVQSDTNKSCKPAPAAVASGKRKVAAWDTKGQLELANSKIEKLLHEKENLVALTHDAQAVKDQLDACEKTQEALRSELQEAYDKHQKQGETISSLKNKCSSLAKEKEALESRIESLDAQFTEAKRQLERLEEQLDLCRTDKEELKIVSSQLQRDLEKKEELNSELTSKLHSQEAETAKLRNDVLNLQEMRRQMHNQILDLKGNIRVFCRVRPPLDKEAGKAIANFNFPDEATLEVKSSQDSGSAKKTNEFNFTFDKVFSPNHNQDDIYAELSQLVQSALDGYNVCVFAYGQTGSGKTYTMEGGNTSDSQGMIPRAIDTVFATIEKQKQLGWKYTVSCSFLEIYNEVIRDLLNPKSNLSYDIKMVGSDDVCVTNLKVEKVESAEELRRLLAKAQKSRFVAATIMNQQSSRSHSIVQIKIESSHAERNIQCQGTINLIDLAGSEKYNSENLSDRKKETCNINKSLATLTLVIMHLVEKSGHVAFRDSKLTHLLMPSLKGNSKTLMLVNIAPLEDCFSETMSSLKFASRVSAVELAAKRQIKSKMVVRK